MDKPQFLLFAAIELTLVIGALVLFFAARRRAPLIRRRYRALLKWLSTKWRGPQCPDCTPEQMCRECQWQWSIR